jgi:hypothetical protein
MIRILGMLGVAATGATLMYFFDPDRGRRRRALVRDKAISLANHEKEIVSVMARDLSNRAQGIKHKATHLRDDHPSDEILEARVRSAMGRSTSSPSAVIVSASEGHVTLSGDILAHEAQALIACVRKVRGVKDVSNEMTMHESADDVPALQSDATNGGSHRWTPGTSLVMSVAGLGLAGYGAVRRGMIGTAASAVGLGLVRKGLRDVEHRFDPSS